MEQNVGLIQRGDCIEKMVPHKSLRREIECGIHGKIHRVGGPAAVFCDGMNWCIDDMFHREDGPAVESFDGTKYWYTRDKLHRIDGPAKIDHEKKEEWYANGIQINFEEIVERHHLNPDWTAWTESEKLLFRLAI
jgi:hypothetical protein